MARAPGPGQLPLPFDWHAAGREGSLIVTEANGAVVDALARAAEWPVAAALLVGPPRSGKSLYARLFAERAGGAIADDADAMTEEALFHAWNRARGEGRPLLMTATRPPGEWRVALPDLRSRLAAALMIAIPPPDDAMVEALLLHHLSRMGVNIGPDALAFAARRIERDHAGVEAFAEAANARALAERRPVTSALIRSLLAPGDGGQGAFDL